MLVRREPAAPLRGLVTALYGYAEDTGVPTRRYEGPGSAVVLILGFDTTWWVGDALDPAAPGGTFESFIGGMRQGQVLTEHPGHSCGVQLDLTPHAARELFRVPPAALAEQIIPLDDLLGRGAARLVERLQEETAWERRFEVLEQDLTARLADARPPQPGVAWAEAQLRASHGRARVSELARELGWSRKRLVAEFREHVGITPKALARVLRFERAVELAEAGGRSWIQIALESGYYDQSHLINEFRAISGRTPGTFFQDGTPSAA